MAVALSLSALLTVHLAMLGGPSFAQTASPTATDTSPAPSPSDTLSPSPSDTGSASPSPSDTASPSPSVSDSPSASPSISPSASVSPVVSPSASGSTSTSLATSPALLGSLDTTIQGTASFGGARTTEKLLAILGELDKNGVPTLDQMLTVDKPFPVAGLAYWVDDWHAYRCCPRPHLHQGVDMMADRGTPLVSVAKGVVSAIVNQPLSSGLGVDITDGAGTRYFYAHLDKFAPGLHVGQEVRMRDVIGFVGNTGDAAGGPTHLHFEVHPYGGVAVPPKPYVDAWLDAAQVRAVHLVRKLTGKKITDKNLDLSLWRNRLYELAQHEIQSANVLAVRNHAAALAAQRKKAGVDQQTMPYTLPVVLLALLAGAMLFVDRLGVPGSFRKRRDLPDEDEGIVSDEIEAAILRDVEAALAEAEEGIGSRIHSLVEL